MLLELESSARVLHQSSSLLACRGTAFKLFSNQFFLHTPCSFPLSVCCTLLSRNSAPASVHFSLEQVGISRTYNYISALRSYSVPTSGHFSLEHPRFFYFVQGGEIRNTPDCPGSDNYTLLWKMRLGKCPLSLFSMARRCISTRTLSSDRGFLTGTSWA